MIEIIPGTTLTVLIGLTSQGDPTDDETPLPGIAGAFVILMDRVVKSTDDPATMGFLRFPLVDTGETMAFNEGDRIVTVQKYLATLDGDLNYSQCSQRIGKSGYGYVYYPGDLLDPFVFAIRAVRNFGRTATIGG